MAHGGNDNAVMYHTGLSREDLEGARFAKFHIRDHLPNG